MHQRDVSHGISRMRHSFQRNPLNYMSKDSIAADLRDELRKWEEPITFTCAQEEESVGYKAKYIESLCRDGQNVHAVQMNVPVGDPDDHHVFDIAILRKQTTVNIYNGRIFVSPSSIQHALVLSYIPVENLVQPSFFNEDLEQLQNVESADSHWLLVASNKNVFQHKQRDNKYYERAKEYREDLEDICEEKDVQFEELHP